VEHLVWNCDFDGPVAAVRFRTASAERRLLFDPELMLGEIFMDGSLVMERGAIADLLAIAMGA
jgi:cyclopropane-fatty-acyl-phospholipid synthase